MISASSGTICTTISITTYADGRGTATGDSAQRRETGRRTSAIDHGRQHHDERVADAASRSTAATPRR